MSGDTTSRPGGNSLRAAIRDRLPRGSLGRNALVVFIPSGVVGVFGVTRDAVLARRFGLGLAMDTWAIGLAVMGYASSAFRGSLETVGVPLIVSAEHDTSRAESRQTAIHVMFVASAFAVVVAALVAALRHPLVRLLAGGNSATTAALEPVVVLLGSVAAGFMIAEAGPRAVLQARQRYALAAIAPLVPSLVVMGYLVFAPTPSVADVAAAMALGAAIELALVALPALVEGAGHRPLLAGFIHTARTLLSRILSMATASVVFGALPLVDLWFAARLGEGQAATLSLAGRVPLGLAALLWTALATPMLTDLSVASTQGGPTAVKAVLARRLRRIGVLSTVVAVGLAALSIPMALVLYRGQRLDFDAAVDIGLIQMAYCAFLVPSTVGIMLVRAFQAMRRVTELVAISCVGLITNIVVDAAAGALLGLVGIALATAVVYVVTSLLLWRRLVLVVDEHDRRDRLDAYE